MDITGAVGVPGEKGNGRSGIDFSAESEYVCTIVSLITPLC